MTDEKTQKTDAVETEPEATDTEVAAADAEVETQTAEVEAPEVEPEAPEAEGEAAETEVEAPEVEPEAPEAEGEAAETEAEAPEAEGEADETEAEAPEAEGEADETEAPKEETSIPGMYWYVLRVQSNKEDSVQENLEKRIKAAGLQKQIARVLVPTEKVSEMKGGKKRVTERKIYPGYVMVEMVMTDESWYLVRETPGIGDFVGGAPNTRPMPMPKHEVDKMLGEADKIEEEQPKLKIAFLDGEAVKITEGPFENFNGVVQEVIPSKGLVKVEVTIFGRPTPVELEYWQIESI